MSTRAVIARKTESGFSGVYHHWDGYPQGLGAHLFETVSTEEELTRIIDEHPAGWSTLMDGKPECYCHSRGEGTNVTTLTEKNAAACGCEFAYVFGLDEKRPGGVPYLKGVPYTRHGAKRSFDGQINVMEVWSSYTRAGEKMIGAFGRGDDDAEWRKVVSIYLDEEEPDWDEVADRVMGLTQERI